MKKTETTNQKMDKVFVGIDPGSHTGFAEWNANRKEFRLIVTLTFWETIRELMAYRDIAGFFKQPCLVTVVLEDPNLNKPVWIRPGQDGRKHIKIAQDVGKNKRDAQLLYEWLKYNTFDVRLIRPSGKGTTKMKADQFRKLTGWTDKTNEHERDAAMMVFGM